MKRKLLLIGAGGHCKSVIDVIEQQGLYEVYGIVGIKDELWKDILGYRVIGTDEELVQLFKDCKLAFVTIGHLGNAIKRMELFIKCKRIGYEFPVLISPYAYVSKHSFIDEGTVVMHHAVINASARIGKNCIINSMALVEHDALVEDNCHISTGAIVNGGVHVKTGTFFGSNATSKQYSVVPSNSFIKAGSVIK